MRELSRYVREGMDRLSLNYSDLARKTGISAVYVMKIVKGERIPSYSVIGKLARALKLDTRRALFLAHNDRAPDEFRDLFRLPEPRFPVIRETLIERYEGSPPEAQSVFETDRLGQLERALLGLFARLIAERALVDPAYRDRYQIGDGYLERLEWGEAYFTRLEEELGPPRRQKEFCDALGESIEGWNLDTSEDTVRVKFVGGREREYKFCLLDTGKFRRELVLESVKSRAAGKEKLKVIPDAHGLSRGTTSRGKEGTGALTFEQYLLDRLSDDLTRDFVMKALDLPREELEEMREIVSLKLRRSARKSDV